MSTGGGFSLEYYPSDQLIQYRPKDGATSVYCYSSEYSDEEASANTASISAADAEQKGTDFLASCGISDVIETSNFDLLWDYSREEWLYGNIQAFCGRCGSIYT